ncbi:MAG: hypothetical protein ACO3AR_05875 [Bacteroidia bacterium]
MIELSSCKSSILGLIDALFIGDGVAAVVPERLGFCCAARSCVKDKNRIISHFVGEDWLGIGWLLVSGWQCFIKTGSR